MTNRAQRSERAGRVRNIVRRDFFENFDEDSTDMDGGLTEDDFDAHPVVQDSGSMILQHGVIKQTAQTHSRSRSRSNGGGGGGETAPAEEDEVWVPKRGGNGGRRK